MLDKHHGHVQLRFVQASPVIIEYPSSFDTTRGKQMNEGDAEFSADIKLIIPLNDEPESPNIF